MPFTPSQRDVLAALAGSPKGRRALESASGRDDATVRRALRGALVSLVVVSADGPAGSHLYSLNEAGKRALEACAAHASPTHAPTVRAHAPRTGVAHPSAARGVSSQPLTVKRSNEEKSSSSGTPRTPAPPMGGAHQEPLLALEWMTAYAKRIERELLEKDRQLDEALARLELLERVSPEKRAPLRALEPSPLVTVPVSTSQEPKCSAPSSDPASHPVTREEIELAAQEELHQHNELVKQGNPKAKPITRVDRWLEPKLVELARQPDRVRKRLEERRTRLAALEAAKSAPPPKPVRVVDDLARTRELMRIRKSLSREELSSIEDKAREQIEDENAPRDVKKWQAALETRVMELIEKQHGSTLERIGAET